MNWWVGSNLRPRIFLLHYISISGTSKCPSELFPWLTCHEVLSKLQTWNMTWCFITWNFSLCSHRKWGDDFHTVVALRFDLFWFLRKCNQIFITKKNKKYLTHQSSELRWSTIGSWVWRLHSRRTYCWLLYQETSW